MLGGNRAGCTVALRECAIIATLLIALVVAGEAKGSPADRARAPEMRAAASKPGVVVRPGRVASGERVRISGRNWPARKRVQLLIGRPQSEAYPFARVRTNRRGAFSRRLRLRRYPTGRWVVLACRRACAVKAKDSFRIKAGKGRAAKPPVGSRRNPYLWSELPRETYRSKPRRAAYGFEPTFVGPLRELKLRRLNWRRWGRKEARTKARARYCLTGGGCGRSGARVRAGERVQYEGVWFYHKLLVTLPRSSGVKPRRFVVCALRLACFPNAGE